MLGGSPPQAELVLHQFLACFSSLPSQTHEPEAVSVHTEESCGLWVAFPRLGTSRKIKSGLQEGIK